MFEAALLSDEELALEIKKAEAEDNTARLDILLTERSLRKDDPEEFD